MESMNGESQDLDNLISDMIKHGTRHVETNDLFRESVLVWHIPAGTVVSRTSIRLEEFMSSAARNCKSALDVIDKIDSSKSTQDQHLFTALRKYVEDTCQAIKEVDTELQARGSGLAELLFEFPNRSSNDEATWRNLIGRRDVIAHQSLTVDDQRVYDETKSVKGGDKVVRAGG